MERRFFCPITGLEIQNPSKWRKIRVSDSFTANFMIIGDSIIYSRPEGRADIKGVRNSLAMNDEVAASLCHKDKGYVQIEDYSRMAGSSHAARNYFIRQMNSRKLMEGLVFCNLSAVLAIAVSIGERFKNRDKLILVAKSYSEAMKKALGVCEEKGLSKGACLAPDKSGSETGMQTIKPVSLLSDNSWHVDLPGYSNKITLLDNRILHSVSKGMFREEHIPLLEKIRHKCLAALPSEASIDYFLIDAANIEGSGGKARLKLMQSLKEWHKNHPIKIYIFYNGNPSIKTAVSVSRILMPFRVRLAKDFEHAMKIVDEDRGRKKKSSKDLGLDRSYPIFQDIEKLTAFIAGINWDREGLDTSLDFDEEHPLYILLQSIKLIKEEVDGLFTERQSLVEQLFQSAKEESIGRLAGGVAHDYNNMLGVILGHAEMALEMVRKEDPVHEEIEEIQKAATKSADLTRQLLAFARKQTITPKSIDLNDIVTGMLGMLRRLIGEDIRLAWMPGANLWQVMMDPSQLDQVLANLCVNARDSISGPGEITIKTRNVKLDESYRSREKEFYPGDYVSLKVHDNGCGMDRETLDNIFEPFFTTKGIGKGTGLGLSTIYGIIRQNKGFINVKTSLNEGTVFEIHLPRHFQPEMNSEKENEKKPIAGGSGQAILLVEDEAPIIKIATRMLGRMGYEVFSASEPKKALSIAALHKNRLELLITDVVMPEMNGHELAEKIGGICPDMKVLFMSGYPADVIAKRGVLENNLNFIQKPFSYKELAGKVGEVLLNTDS